LIPVPNDRKLRKVLIVSSHPLFGKGIQRMLETHHAGDVQVVGMVASVDDAVAALRSLHPDLVIVDYDDNAVNREEFLAYFMEGESQMRVVLFSLKEGGSNAIVYDRRSMEASEVSDWLKEWESQGNEGQDRHMALLKKTDHSSRKVEYKGNPMKHAIGAVLLIVLFTILGLFVLRTDILLPEQASVQAQRIDWLFDIHFKIIAFLFALIVGLTVYSIIFFRRKKGDMEDGVYIVGSNTVEFAWTVIPLMLVISVAYIGSGVLTDTMRMDPRALEVKVIGQQWSWRFEYPDQEVASTELVVPVDKQVLLRLTSEDVIHSFWVPEFRVKQDAIPGGFRELRVTPNMVGEFQMVCTELCGTQHAYMTAPVRVVSQTEFEEWIASIQIPTDPVGRGEYWYRIEGCAACHSLDGSKIVGPSFQGLLGRTEVFIDGTSRVADEEYIRESILDPYAQIVEGYELSPGSGTSAMPTNYGEKLTDEQIQDIIEFIKTLE
jgi:cytochrome c oxidase subunit II